MSSERALTREQIKAMRSAETVVFRFDHSSEEHSERTGEIDLQKEVERGDGFGSVTLHVRIPVVAGVTNYGGHDYSDDPEGSALAPAIKGTWVLTSAKHHAAWATVTAFVRLGDEIEQRWVVDNRNTLLKRARLTMHELFVQVRRTRRGGRVAVHAFMLDARTLDPYSLADYVERKRS